MKGVQIMKGIENWSIPFSNKFPANGLDIWMPNPTCNVA